MGRLFKAGWKALPSASNIAYRLRPIKMAPGAPNIFIIKIFLFTSFNCSCLFIGDDPIGGNRIKGGGDIF